LVVGQTVTVGQYARFDDFESLLKERVSQDLAEWPDVLQHTLDVVQNMKRLVVREGGPMDILVCVAYLHEVARAEAGDIVLDGKSLTMARAEVCSKQAAAILSELGFPSEKAVRVQNLLARNECVELKRSHHRIV